MSRRDLSALLAIKAEPRTPLNGATGSLAYSGTELVKSEQGDKWSFCLTAGTLVPANQERPLTDDRAGTTRRASRRRWRLPPSSVTGR